MQAIIKQEGTLRVAVHACLLYNIVYSARLRCIRKCRGSVGIVLAYDCFTSYSPKKG